MPLNALKTGAKIQRIIDITTIKMLKSKKIMHYALLIMHYFVPLHPHFGKSDASDDVSPSVIRQESRPKDVYANNI